MCIAQIRADKVNLEFVQSSKNIIEAYSRDENEMNTAAPVPMSSEMRSIMKTSCVAWFVCHSPSAPKVAGMTPVQVGGLP
ncbi:hypothetical protein TNCV_1296931 [Trichonephila clavipes]|uniref:Uncharacterized protein n=1 Tax=Trichonephila clavipes TaxID=2585209 RepID=A0A8X6VD62_TRICX|nr:hypothetical protein TNCV_1296931 [Trichonephila clavipes]